tara:strand:- start:873 stop:1481 length:609 start_codon:yes stop_codon:yes gene_type:complete
VLVLASASRARRELLEASKISHKVMVSGLDESSFACEDFNHLVRSISEAKARKIVSQIIQENYKYSAVDYVLGCDSLFVIDGEVFGKPISNDQAIKRWKKMANNKGLLITGHTLFIKYHPSQLDSGNYFEYFVQAIVSTNVFFSDLTDEEINSYVISGEGMNSCGGFTLEGKSLSFISKINGCYSNVLGLSMPWLRKQLLKF